MIYKEIVVLFILCSCVSKSDKDPMNTELNVEDPIIANAKWYFYSYAMGLQASDKGGELLRPLDYELNIRRIKNPNSDTISFLISAFKGDSSNTCIFRPLNILGITLTQNRIYTPIYHQIEFDEVEDSILIAIMDSLSSNLRQKILNNEIVTNKWLIAQSKIR